MTTLGNISLLDLPLHGFLCSRCTKSTAILPCLDWASERRNSHEPVISTFHSELEDAVLDILIKGTCPIVLVLGRTPYKVLPAKLQLLMDSGRLLIVSLSVQGRITRDSAHQCNDYISRTATTLTFGYVSKESSISEILNRVKESKKQIDILLEC